MLASRIATRSGLHPGDDFWYRPVWLSGSDGEPIQGLSPDGAMGLSAWWNGIGLISAAVGSLPLKLVRQDGREKQLAKDDPRYWLLFRKPNPWQTAMEWREMGQGHLLTRGNFYSRVVRDGMDRIRRVVPLHPERVKPEVRGDRIVYVFQGKDGKEDLQERQVLHLRGLGSNGLVGHSVVSLAARSLGYALQLEDHGSQLMGNKARPGGVLRTDQVLKKETKNDLGATWDNQFSGGGLGRTAVLDAGLEWQQVGFSAEDAQFIESRKFQITEVARWLNIPPHFLKDLERSTFSNIEHQALEYVIHTIRPWVERWEQRLDISLLEEDEQEEYSFKFNLEALLRGDSETRAKFYNALFRMAVYSPNDIRELEDRNPVPGGDTRFVELNLIPLEQASDPFGSMMGEQEGGDERTPDPERSLRTALATRALHLQEARSDRSLRLRRRLMVTYERLMDGAGERLVRREVQDLRRMLDAVDEGDVNEWFRRLDGWGEKLPDAVRSIMGPLLVAYADLVADAAAEEVGMEEIPDGEVERFTASYVETLSRGHTTETLDRMRQTVDPEAEDPFGGVREQLDRWEDNRARTIATSEAVTEGGAIARVIYGLAGVASVWRAMGDSCPLCQSLDGLRVAPGERFVRRGEVVDPGDPDHEPLVAGRNIGHPQLHDGCDCMVVAGF